MAMLRLTLTDLDGNLLDSTEVSREDFAVAQANSMEALALINTLVPGSE